jgi:ABC-type multidrug transport system ATPase subunit
MDLYTDNTKIKGIAGGNGSGKSTLLHMLSGYVSPTLGEIAWTINDVPVKAERIFQHISWVGPYTGVVNEFHLREMFAFHQKFKPLQASMTFAQFEELIKLKGHADKPLTFFSSGMKQKIQLALAILSATPILLLDEPTAFLDQQARQWFTDMLSNYAAGRVVVIASNDPFDLSLCQEIITLPSPTST